MGGVEEFFQIQWELIWVFLSTGLSDLLWPVESRMYDSYNGTTLFSDCCCRCV